MKSKSIKFWQFIFLIAAMILLLLQTFGFWNVTGVMAGKWQLIKIVSTFGTNLIELLVMMVFGASYGNKKHPISSVIKIWLTGVVTLIIFQLTFFMTQPTRMVAWNLLGTFFPVLASTAVLFSGIIFALIAEPYLFDIANKYSNKQLVVALSTITVFLFIISGTIAPGVTYSIFGFYLILAFAWGLVLRQIKISTLKAIIWLIVAALIAIFINVLTYQLIVMQPNQMALAAAFATPNSKWDTSFLISIISPVMYVVAIGIFIPFRQLLSTYTNKQLLPIIPAIMFADAPFAIDFWLRNFKLMLPSAFSKKRALAILIVLTILSFVIAYLVSYISNKLPGVKRLNEQLSVDNWHDTFALLQKVTAGIIRWYKKNVFLIWTLIYFLIMTVVTFYIVSDKGIIQVTSEQVGPFLLELKLGVVLLTLLFIFAIFSLFYLITTRYWVSLSLTSILIFGFAIADQIKLNLRNEPIVPTEIKEAVNWQTLIPMIKHSTLIMILIALIVIIALTIYLELKHPVKLLTIRTRIITAVLGVLLLLTPLGVNNKANPIHYISRAFDNTPTFNNPKWDVQSEGPVLAFLDYIKVNIMQKPSDYSKAEIQQIVKKYQKQAAIINKTRKNKLSDQTFVFNLSESFVDPKEFPSVKFKDGAPDPMPFIRNLSKDTTSGYMLSAGYGGGTADMEYESLTGFTMGNFESAITPYTQVTVRYPFYPTIGMNFPYSSAIHPFIGTYYSRTTNYKIFNFNKFAYLGSKYKIIDQKYLGTNKYMADSTTYNNGIKQIDSRKGGQFISLISIQNHMPYNNYYSPNEFKGQVSGKYINDHDTNTQFTTYAQGVKYTDTALKAFIQKIDKMQKPVTLVFYGDHYPAIIDQAAVSAYPIKLHATTYFIYSNKYARDHGAKAKLAKSKYIATNDFIAMALDQTNSKVTPYQALLTEIYQELPTMTINYKKSSGLELVDQKGKVVPLSKLTAKQKALLMDYKNIQYDMTAGKAYAYHMSDFYRNN